MNEWTTCECGHPISEHQTGEGAWAGFCYADSVNCDCESPVPAESEERLQITIRIEVPVWFPSDPNSTLTWDDLSAAAVETVWGMVDPRIKDVTAPDVLRGPGSMGRYDNRHRPFDPGIMLPLPIKEPEELPKQIHLLAPSGIVHGVSTSGGKTYCGKDTGLMVLIGRDITCKACLR